MKKRLDSKDVILIIVICLIPIFLSFILFSEIQNGTSYIFTVIFSSMCGAFREVVDFYLNSKERDLDAKLNELGFELCIYSVLTIFLTLFFNYTGIVDLIITVLVIVIPFFIDNMIIYLIAEKR